MTDIADKATQQEQLQRELALKKQRQAKQASSPYCLDCGEKIPLQRLKAVAGCVRCLDCQQLAERQQRNYRQ